jgi:hypothetical protein
MHPSKVARTHLLKLTDLPNVGPAVAADLRQLGILTPAQLAGRDPYALYDELCAVTGVRHDPCMIDVLIAAVRFVDGEEARPWWHYTPERRARLAGARS